MGGWLSIAVLLATGPGRPVVPVVLPRPAAVLPAATGVSSLTATPATITFSAADPDTPSDPGNSAGSVTALVTGGATYKTWNLTVQAGSSSFTSCATVPASAVTVSCSAASVPGGTAACAAPFALSRSVVVVASGREAAGTATYQVTVRFTLADSWQYVAKLSPPCSLTLTYSGTYN